MAAKSPRLDWDKLVVLPIWNKDHTEILLMNMNHFVLLRCFTLLYQLQFPLSHFYQPASFEIRMNAVNAWGKLWDLTLSLHILVLPGWKTSLYDISIACKKIYTIFVIHISQWNNCLNKLLGLYLVLYSHIKATFISCLHLVVE